MQAPWRGIGSAQACSQFIAGQRLRPNGTGPGKFHVFDAIIDKIGNVAERENPAKYMKSHAISGANRKSKQFCADGLIRVGYEADAKETRLQTGHDRIQEVFQGVALKAAPPGKRIRIGERLAVKKAGLAARETPFVGLVEVIPFQHQQIWNNIADLFQIEIIPAGGGVFAKQAEGCAAYNDRANDAGNAGGEQPAMMDGFVGEGIVELGFKLVKGYGLALNTNMLSLPVIWCFTVALQYLCPLALNTNFLFFRLVHAACFNGNGPISYDLSIFRHPALRPGEIHFPPLEYLAQAVPHLEPGNHCHQTITAWLTMTAILRNDGENGARSLENDSFFSKAGSRAGNK